MSKLVRENTALKMKGAGDGLKASLTRSTERVPVPSSRKFTATLAKDKDESVQVQLKKVLDEYEAKNQGRKKAKTMAEITPTKSNRRKPRRGDFAASLVLHATPRPPADVARRPPSRRLEREHQLQLLVYHRWFRFVWRRCKSRLAMVSESLRRRQEQISHLENQVKCLKDLTRSECDKRGEALNHCQQMENVLQRTRLENDTLVAEKAEMEKHLVELEKKVEISNIELENMKNELLSKSMNLKKLEHDFQKELLRMKNVKEQNVALGEKVKAQEVELRTQEEITQKLNQTLRNLETQVEKSEEEKQEQASNLRRLSEQVQLKSKNCDCLRQELSQMCSTKDKMKDKIEDLEATLAKLSDEFSKILTENEKLKERIDFKKWWWNNAKDFLTVSWAVLQNAAYIMLPAM